MHIAIRTRQTHWNGPCERARTFNWRVRMLRTILASFILVGVVSACSGDDDGGSGSGTTAAASCADLAKIWCSKSAGCTPGNELTLVRSGSSETHDTKQMCVT